MKHRRLLTVIIVALLCLAGSAFAQAPAAPAAPQASPPSTADIEALMVTLQDPAAREKLLQQLRTLSDAQRATAPAQPAIPDRVASRVLETLSDRVSEAGDSLFSAAAAIADAPQVYRWAREQIVDTQNRARLIDIFGTLVLVLGAGWLAAWGTTMVLAQARRWTEARAAADGWSILPYAALHAILKALPIVIFAAAAFGALTIAAPSRTTRLAALALINANVLAQAIIVVAEVLLSPQARPLRLLPLGDETAAYIDLWTRRLVTLAVYGYFLAEAALLIGLPPDGHQVLLKLLGVLVALLLLVLILQNRSNVAATLTGNRQAEGSTLHGFRRIAAAYWHFAAILYVATVLVLWLARANVGFLFVLRATATTVVILAFARVIRRLVMRLLNRAFRIRDEVRAQLPALEWRANRYLQIFNIVIAVAIYGFAAMAVLQAWGIRSFEWFETPLGQRVSTSAISIGVTLLITLAAWEGVNALLDRYAATAFTHSGRARSRFRTLVTLAQRALLVVLVLFLGLVVLSEMGVNIAPLLAGAGVVGIAVGLGAQTLIKNLIEGISNVLEDTFTVGDIVQIDTRAGVVETITMRVVCLRDYNGHVHTIPFSEIKAVTNMTREFAFAAFDIGVGYGEDIDRVMEILKKEATALRADPKVGTAITDDLEISGVDKLGDSAVIIKARFHVVPAIEQWNVMRAFNRRIKIAFDREGIEIPFPQRTIHMADPRPDPDRKPEPASP